MACGRAHPSVWLALSLLLFKCEVSLSAEPLPAGEAANADQCLDAASDALAPPAFPSPAKAVQVTGKRLQDLLAGVAHGSHATGVDPPAYPEAGRSWRAPGAPDSDGSSEAAANGSSGGSSAEAPLLPGPAPSAVVVLFFLEDCPNSMAMKPVFECLPAFFPTSAAAFVEVEYRDLSLMALMGHGLHALPVLQVSLQGRRLRYSGMHHLEPMLRFVAHALAVEPLASPASAAAHPSWRCSRVDGEPTTQELVGQLQWPLFFSAAAFLVARLSFLAWSHWRQRPRSQAAAGGVRNAGGGGEPQGGEGGDQRLHQD